MEIYFDNSATTKPYEEVIEAVSEAMGEFYGNPSSVNRLGMLAEQKLNDCRERLAKTIHCGKDEILFTSGGSESNNLVLNGFVKAGGHIITDKIEHASVLNTCKDLEQRGIKVTYLNTDKKGKINIQELVDSITKDTQLISIMHVNNEVGTIQDIEAIGKAIKENSTRAKFHVDGVQSYGKFDIDVEKCKIDMLSVSSHKIHGPKGVGFVYLRKRLAPKPLIFGGGQEKGLRSGTENLPGIIGMTVAAERMYVEIKESYEKTRELKTYFISELKAIEEVRINSEGEDFSPYILNVSMKGIRAEVLLRLLDEKGIYVSTGSACSSKDTKESHVLTALGLKSDEIKGSLRFSFSDFNTKNEVDDTIPVLAAGVEFLRRPKRR